MAFDHSIILGHIKVLVTHGKPGWYGKVQQGGRKPDSLAPHPRCS